MINLASLLVGTVNVYARTCCEPGCHSLSAPSQFRFSVVNSSPLYIVFRFHMFSIGFLINHIIVCHQLQLRVSLVWLISTLHLYLTVKYSPDTKCHHISPLVLVSFFTCSMHLLCGLPIASIICFLQALWHSAVQLSFHTAKLFQHDLISSHLLIPPLLLCPVQLHFKLHLMCSNQSHAIVKNYVCYF